MDIAHRSWWDRLLRPAKTLFWMAMALIVFQQLWGPARLAAARSAALDDLQQQRHSRVIAMIHRQDTVSLFGVPVSSSIGIEDSEAVLRAIRSTPPDQPIDLILHTPGGLVLAAEQIALALLERTGKVTVFVPHYAMSGGTLLALTADEIVMDPTRGARSRGSADRRHARRLDREAPDAEAARADQRRDAGAWRTSRRRLACRWPRSSPKSC